MTELPMIPEPAMTAEEKASLAEAMRKDSFWDEFECLPDPGLDKGTGEDVASPASTPL